MVVSEQRSGPKHRKERWGQAPWNERTAQKWVVHTPSGTQKSSQVSIVVREHLQGVAPTLFVSAEIDLVVSDQILGPKHLKERWRQAPWNEQTAQKWVVHTPSGT